MYRFSPKFALRSAAFSACAAAIVCLSGCAGISGTAVSSSLAVSTSKGSIHGGQQPIQGAHVYVYAANLTGGYGSASTSLLTAAPGTTIDTNGNYYVTTGSSGEFNYSVNCTDANNQQIYLMALGGNTTGLQGGAPNGALALGAALGTCANITSSTFTSINEVTTVAMAFALNPFIVDASHIGSPSTNVAGLRLAFQNVASLVNNTTGTALATTPGGNGVAPQKYVNTLANIIAPCANSGSGASSACGNLLTHATPTNSSTPLNVFAAMVNVAAFPGAQTGNLYNDALATAPFQPALTSAPNDFALGITYSAPIPVGRPGPVVIDKNGNIWMANCQTCTTPTATDSILEFGPDGTLLHSYSNAGVHATQGLAINAAGTVIYSINQAVTGSTHTQDQLTAMSTTTGAVQTGFPVTFAAGTYGTNSFYGVAVDNSGEIWASALTVGAVIELDPNGNVINGGPFFVGGTNGIAADNVGNIWFAGTGGNNLIQFDTNGNFLNNFTPSGLNQPLAVAINGSNEIWTINNGNNTLSKIEYFNGSNGSGSPYGAIGLYQAAITAIDGSNEVLIPNCRASCFPSSGSNLPDNLLRLNQSGQPSTGGSGASYGAQIPTFSGVGGVAIDIAGNVWVSNSVSGTITEVLSYASPTIQPIAFASSNAKLGQLP